MGIEIPAKIRKRRRLTEAGASFGLILIALGLVVPFANFDNIGLTQVFKWVFCIGAVLYTAARMVNVNAPGDGMRVRRLRRMEVWGGVAFCVAGGFWWYNEMRFGAAFMSLKVLHETILFTLAGAMIQIVSSWLIVQAVRKQRGEHIGPDAEARAKNTEKKD